MKLNNRLVHSSVRKMKYTIVNYASNERLQLEEHYSIINYLSNSYTHKNTTNDLTALILLQDYPQNK